MGRLLFYEVKMKEITAADFGLPEFESHYKKPVEEWVSYKINWDSTTNSYYVINNTTGNTSNYLYYQSPYYVRW